MPDECAHARTIRNVTPSALGCEECLKLGSAWMHLRLCRTCGHVGCCDNSPNRHATKATIRRKGGDGAKSMKSVWTLAAARRGITDQSRGTIKFAAWGKIATVLQHPRRLNCHQLNSPLQGDARRIHAPRFIRGPDNHGVGAMRCGDCHHEMGN
jgi:hypothetical protein